MHAKNEIVAIARGYYALPIINALNRRGLVRPLLEGGLALADVAGNSKNLGAVFGYLGNLGWLRQERGRWVATDLGRSILNRAGAFAILYSYRPYMNNLEQLLFDPTARVHVHRDENVTGSGEAHVKKYFARLRDLLGATDAEYLVDVGCGDGTFLSFAKETNPRLELVGVDFSERALEVTRSHLKHEALLLHGNVSQPLATLERLLARGIDPERILVSVWFIFHEVLGFPGIVLEEMLTGYKKLAPRHGLVIGEIFDVPREVLARHHNETAIPEFNLFHDLSGQKLFTLERWREAIARAGWHENRFIGLDALEHDGRTVHGSAIWHLT